MGTSRLLSARDLDDGRGAVDDGRGAVDDGRGAVRERAHSREASLDPGCLALLPSRRTAETLKIFLFRKKALPDVRSSAQSRGQPNGTS
jgi:hypothetical protein